MKNFVLITAIEVLFFMLSYAQPASVSAANAFIKMLSKDQQAKAVYPFDAEERFNFNFVPKNDRKGISLNELSAAQKGAAMTLLKTVLSSQGYKKTTEIIQLETILKAIEKRGADDHYRDPGKYFFTIFGVPRKGTTWGWRLEGHHVALNFSATKDKLFAATPGFMGSNPAVVPDGPEKGKQILKEETEMGFALLNSFSDEQHQQLMIGDQAPNEIITLNHRKALIENPSGLSYADMNSVQQQKLLELIGLYVHRYTKLFAEDMMNEIKMAGLNKLRFAWAGARKPGIGNPHYYRIQGPTFIIEYDNIQNNANHVHTVVRDLVRDFGGDLLLEHYKASH